ncbi:MAG: indolepyruvate oxidoreductase subunit beta [Candidatus Brocadiaceae bacterium]
MSETANVLIVGVGGQGVLKTAQVLADVLMRFGHDVKQSEVHGMSQRGGSVVSEVRYGPTVHSPLSPHEEADFIIALEDGEGRRAAPRLRDGGRLIDVPPELTDSLETARSRNMAALGRLSRSLEIPPEHWHESIVRFLPPATIEGNVAAFEAGRRFED